MSLERPRQQRIEDQIEEHGKFTGILVRPEEEKKGTKKQTKMVPTCLVVTYALASQFAPAEVPPKTRFLVGDSAFQNVLFCSVSLAWFPVSPSAVSLAIFD